MKEKFTIPNYILASKNTRALNFILDIIVVNIIHTILYFVAAFIGFNEDYKSLLEYLNSFDKAQNFLLWSLLLFIYYSIFEILFARTISKYFTNTVVVLADGSKPKPIDILSRTVLRIVPFEYFTFLKGRESGWHDEYSGTFVVIKDKLEKSKKEFLELQSFKSN